MFLCFSWNVLFFYWIIWITDEPSQNGSLAYTAQNGGLNTPHTVVNQTMSIIPISAGGAPGAVPGPTTNLNIGMDYWGTPASSNIPALGRKVPSTAVAGGMVTVGSRDSAQSQLWLQVIFYCRLMIWWLLPWYIEEKN